jgi:selenocysteine lyase/cysteine desulfurase
VGFPAPHQVEWALAALDVLERPGWTNVHERAADLAAALAQQLAERARPRGRSTLVAWQVPDPAAEVERLRAAGFAVRELPGQGTVRASVGAWSSEHELARLAELTCS